MNYAKCPNLIKYLSTSLQPKNYPIKNISHVCAINPTQFLIQTEYMSVPIKTLINMNVHVLYNVH